MSKIALGVNCGFKSTDTLAIFDHDQELYALDFSPQFLTCYEKKEGDY